MGFSEGARKKARREWEKRSRQYARRAETLSGSFQAVESGAVEWARDRQLGIMQLIRDLLKEVRAIERDPRPTNNEKQDMVQSTREIIQDLETELGKLSDYIHRCSKSTAGEIPVIQKDEKAGFLKQGVFSTKYFFNSGTFKTGHGLSAIQLRELKLDQRAIPVRVGTDPKRHLAWWMYGGEFYQGDDSYSGYEIKEAYETTDGVTNIKFDSSSRFVVRVGEREVTKRELEEQATAGEEYEDQKFCFEAKGFRSRTGFTVNQMQELLQEREEAPQIVATDPVFHRRWWTYHRGYYVAHDSVGQREVQVVVDEMREMVQRAEDEIRELAAKLEAQKERKAKEGTKQAAISLLESEHEGFFDEMRDLRQKAQEVLESRKTPSAASRQPIPDDVKKYVWNRDGGQCVNCGSKEKLEYDHIIPVSMGGSNTARNLQLLCETCNRSKGGNLS